MWDSAMWFGKGLGSYKLNLPFLVEQGDWTFIPVEPKNAVNGYYTFIAERGIVGCMMLVALVGVFVWMYLQRFTTAFIFLRRQDDVDPMIFSCLPISWAAPIALTMVLVETAYTSVSAQSTFLTTSVAPLVLAAASFPKPPHTAKT
jgi:O-antigen ligase